MPPCAFLMGGRAGFLLGGGVVGGMGRRMSVCCCCVCTACVAWCWCPHGPPILQQQCRQVCPTISVRYVPGADIAAVCDRRLNLVQFSVPPTANTPSVVEDTNGKCVTWRPRQRHVRGQRPGGGSAGYRWPPAKASRDQTWRLVAALVTFCFG